MSEIMVKQWSFSPYYEGQKPDKKDRYEILIPLESLPRVAKGEYKKAQADFIKAQREGQKEEG